MRALFGDRQPDPAMIDAITKRLGYDDPCLDQKGNWCIGLFGERLQSVFLHFDFGINLRSAR